MGFTRKASKMYGYIQGYKYKISDGLGEMFFAPLSKKIVGRLKKRYDNKIPVDKIIAFCDTSVFIQAKRGIIFTEDGFYHKFIGTPIFISYKSIDSILIGDNGLEIHTDNYFSYTLTDAFNYAVLKSVLLELKSIDNAYGQNVSRESGKITEKSAIAQVGKAAKSTAKVTGKVVGTAVLGTTGAVSVIVEGIGSSIASDDGPDILEDIGYAGKTASFNGIRKMWGKEPIRYEHESSSNSHTRDSCVKAENYYRKSANNPNATEKEKLRAKIGLLKAKKGKLVLEQKQCNSKKHTNDKNIEDLSKELDSKDKIQKFAMENQRLNDTIIKLNKQIKIIDKEIDDLEKQLDN